LEEAAHENIRGPKSDLVIKINKTQKMPRARAVTKKKRKRMPIRNRLQKFNAMKITEGLYSKKKAGVAIVEPKVMEPFDPVPG